MDIKTIKKEVKKQINSAETLKDLDDIFKKYLGKKGKITQILRSLKDLSEKQKKETGKLANEIKKELESAVENKKYWIYSPVFFVFHS